jgi:hypothetical protein
VHAGGCVAAALRLPAWRAGRLALGAALWHRLRRETSSVNNVSAMRDAATLSALDETFGEHCYCMRTLRNRLLRDVQWTLILKGTIILLVFIY